LKNKLAVLNTLAVLVILASAVFHFGGPAFAKMMWGEEFKSLMYECDHAMKEHYIAKRRVEIDVSDMALKNLDATRLGLMVCHDYDKVNKRLELMGMNREQISDLGLEAIEERNYDLSKFVETHEFRYK